MSRVWTVIGLSICLLCLTYGKLSAKTTHAHSVYLPMVLYGQAAPSDENGHDDYDYVIDWNVSVTRLLSAQENGPPLDGSFECGSNRYLTIHVFGPDGEPARLDGVEIQVTHLNDVGEEVTESSTTGPPNFDSGVVRFELERQATFRLITDSAGRSVHSESATVSTSPQDIPFSYLSSAGYCTDQSSCQRFVDENRCGGRFSWNVVFKQAGRR